MLETNSQNKLSFQQNSALMQRLKDRNIFEQVMRKHDDKTSDAPKGRLVKETVPEQFVSMITDTGKDARNLGKALVKGKATDTQLGRLNDLGMKLGGGLIAAALMGSKSTGNKKLMEFVGFGTFFSTMALWPKLAIDLPTKLLYGFNPHQKYIDSNGDKKPFFLDNQYLPWDIWSKEEINAIADKMGVSKDLKDREEYTKEKMRTIALQDNTLWMLTAGFATPLLTSLICNRIENGLKTPLANNALKKISKQIPNIEEQAKTVLTNTRMFAANDHIVSEITDSLRRGVVPKDMVEKLSTAFDVTAHVQNGDVRAVLFRNNKSAVEQLLSKIMQKSPEFSAFAKVLAGGDGDGAVQEIVELYQEAYKSMNGASDNIRNLTERALDIATLESEGAYEGKKWLERLLDGGLSKEALEAGSTQCGYSQETLTSAARTLDETYKMMKNAQAYNSVLERQVLKLSEVSGEKYNRVARVAVEALGFTDGEITQLKKSGNFGTDIVDAITRKIKSIAQNESEYTRVMEKLEKAKSKVGQTASSSKGAKETVSSVFDSLTDAVSGRMKGLTEGLSKETAEALEDSSLVKGLQAGITQKQAASMKSNISSVEAMISKMTSMLTLERSMADGSFMKKWAEVAKANGFDPTGLSESEIKDWCRNVAWNSSYGDAVNKFSRFGVADNNGRLYRTVVDTVFGLSGQDVEPWQEAARSISLEGEYIPNTALKINLSEGMSDTYVAEKLKTHKVKFADFGESVTGTLKKQVNQMYNDKKWMKVFGGATLILIGATLISQLFFGKVKDAHLYKKKDQDSFQKADVNGNK